MEEKKTLILKMRENPWIGATLFLVFIISLMLIPQLIEMKNEINPIPINNFDDVCKQITGTPTWINFENGAIQSGYIDFFAIKNMSYDVVNNELIPNKIHFYYATGCGWCERQIELFGDTWKDYVDSGLTHDCVVVGK